MAPHPPWTNFRSSATPQHEYSFRNPNDAFSDCSRRDLSATARLGLWRSGAANVGSGSGCFFGVTYGTYGQRSVGGASRSPSHVLLLKMTHIPHSGTHTHTHTHTPFLITLLSEHDDEGEGRRHREALRVPAPSLPGAGGGGVSAQRNLPRPGEPRYKGLRVPRCTSDSGGMPRLFLRTTEKGGGD